MGNCCGSDANEGEVTLIGGKMLTSKPGDGIYGDWGVSGLGADKMRIIVKIQALFRGVLVRRRIK